MARAAELAQSLVDYDADVARKLRDVIVRELGGSLNAPPNDSDAVTTSDWKEGLAAYERLRSLGQELDRLLD